MSTCSNCDNRAAFNYKPNNGSGTLYCAKHLPSFLKKASNAVLVSPVLTPDAPVATEVKEEAPVEPEEPKTPKKSAPKLKVEVVEEAPSEALAEEAPTETAPEEEPNK